MKPTNVDYVSSYDGEFYSSRRDMTLLSARRVLELVRQVIPFSSVADFGCGSGTWLSVAIDEFGVSKAYGVEGPWMTEVALDNAAIEFRPQNLEQPVTLPRVVDLAISLEVAEHLSEHRAPSFVDDLCAASPCVLFGAAIPGQGGVGHVNEQWPSWWAQLFDERGYVPFDIIRPAVWGEAGIPYWYQQNILLYIHKDKAAELGLCAVPAILDLVHPSRWREELNVPLWRRVRQSLGASLRGMIA